MLFTINREKGIDGPINGLMKKTVRRGTGATAEHHLDYRNHGLEGRAPDSCLWPSKLLSPKPLTHFLATWPEAPSHLHPKHLPGSFSETDQSCCLLSNSEQSSGSEGL